MCLYPRFIKNPAYSKQKYLKIGVTQDERKKYVPIGCGECLECRRQKAQMWRVRLCEELKVNKYAYFVTLTFDNDNLEKLAKEVDAKNAECNAVATHAIRRFLERWRKKYKKSLRHWLITELGHDNTERIHLHGIIFSDFEISNELLQSFWKYGLSDTGQYCNIQTINYIVKYVTKIDADHKNYKAVILTSAGIGKAFTETIAAKNTYKYRPHKTIEYYTLSNGYKVALPIYYRNKFWSPKERANLWTERLDKGEIFVNGIRIRNIESEESQKYYYKLLEDLQRDNINLGYGDTSKNWQKEKYNITFKMLQTRKGGKNR